MVRNESPIRDLVRSRGFEFGFGRDWDGDMYMSCDDPDCVQWVVTFTEAYPDETVDRRELPLETGAVLLTNSPESKSSGGWESVPWAWCIEPYGFNRVCHIELEITDPQGVTDYQWRKLGFVGSPCHHDQ